MSSNGASFSGIKKLRQFWSATQDSRNALNRSRTGKNPFLIYSSRFLNGFNGCRQRLLSHDSSHSEDEASARKIVGFQKFFWSNNKAFPLLTSKGQAICLQKLQAVVINKDHTKVTRLFEKQTVTPRAFHSVLVRTLSVTNKHSPTQSNTVDTEKSPPWACDKGCAERFPALNRNMGGAIQVVANVSPLSPVTVPEVFAKANSDQFPSRF